MRVDCCLSPRNKEKIGGFFRFQDRFEGCARRIADRTGRKPFERVGIVGLGAVLAMPRSRSIPVGIRVIDQGRVRLQFPPVSHPVVEHPGDQWALIIFYGFFFHNRSQRHKVVFPRAFLLERFHLRLMGLLQLPQFLGKPGRTLNQLSSLVSQEFIHAGKKVALNGERNDDPVLKEAPAGTEVPTGLVMRAFAVQVARNAPPERSTRSATATDWSLGGSALFALPGTSLPWMMKKFR